MNSDHAAAFHTAAAPEAVDSASPSTFGDLCVMFGQPFKIANLRVLDGATLLPVDAWPPPFPRPPTSAAISSASREPRTPRPRPALGRGTPGADAHGAGGRDNFRPGRRWLSTRASPWAGALGDESLLAATITVGPSASLGPHAATVTNPDASSDTLAEPSP